MPAPDDANYVSDSPWTTRASMFADTEQRQGLNREQSFARQISSANGPGPAGGDSFGAKTVSLGAYPTTAQAFYAVQPIDVGGTESEGTAYTATNVGTPVFAANLGTQVPPAGTAVRVDAINGRYVFAYRGS